MVLFWSLQCDAFAYHRGDLSLNVFSWEAIFNSGKRNGNPIYFCAQALFNVSVKTDAFLRTALDVGAQFQAPAAIFSKSELLVLNGKEGVETGRETMARKGNLLLAGNKIPGMPEYKHSPN
jgi:hypothetical protein